MPALLLAQHDNRSLDKATLHALSAARELTAEIDILVAGAGCASVAEAAAACPGVRRVLLVEATVYVNPLAEDLAALLVALAADYDVLVAAATTSGKNIMPRVAALLDVAQVSDVVAVESPDTFKRYVYAGNALATVQSTDVKRVLTVRTTAFPAAANEGGAAGIVAAASLQPSGMAEFLDREVSRSDRPDLGSARIVISGGRGIGSAENFGLVERLADVLGGAVGASRAAVDAGDAANDRQVGQTGKIVAPELYIALGISGAIQHLAGMKDSKVIVAVNKDEEAPIFQIADYGLVGDLFQLVPQLIQELEKAKA